MCVRVASARVVRECESGCALAPGEGGGCGQEGRGGTGWGGAGRVWGGAGGKRLKHVAARCMCMWTVLPRHRSYTCMPRGGHSCACARRCAWCTGGPCLGPGLCIVQHTAASNASLFAAASSPHGICAHARLPSPSCVPLLPPCLPPPGVPAGERPAGAVGACGPRRPCHQAGALDATGGGRGARGRGGCMLVGREGGCGARVGADSSSTRSSCVITGSAAGLGGGGGWGLRSAGRARPAPAQSRARLCTCTHSTGGVAVWASRRALCCRPAPHRPRDSQGVEVPDADTPLLLALVKACKHGRAGSGTAVGGGAGRDGGAGRGWGGVREEVAEGAARPR